ncbi:hypothetical protein [Planctellipticum variicoloris]|uniref:hypothetical protein n=1 Tax=Planctellipticum variicoloris TaxID=3064265 RepID=UPI00301337FA|nr:hypothetical protein SH412_002539 [Planctomycetaceae bacterium SH412]
MDGDTLFVRPVGGIPEINTCVAAVCDFNYTPVKAIRKAVPSEVAAAVGSSLTSLGLAWPSSSFNAGVFLMEDTPEAGQFAARWLEVWNRILNCNDPRVVHLSDQIAFNLTCDELRNSVGTLANRYNTMVPTSPQLTSIASILHFFGSPAQIQGTLLEHLLMRFKETGCLDESAIERCLREGHPWGPHPEAWRYMRSGNVVRAALAKARRTMGFP